MTPPESGTPAPRRLLAFSVLLWGMVVIGACGDAARSDEDDRCWRELADYARVPRDTLRVALTMRSTEDDRAVLYDVRGARRLPDGRIVVANAGTSQLFVYDAEGSLLQVLGRPGAGPGEFGSLQRLVRVAGDTVAAYDLRHKRVSLYAGAPLALVGDFGVEGHFATYPIGFLANGSLVVHSHVDPEGPEATPGPNEVHHQIAAVERDVSRGITVLDTVPGQMLWTGETQGVIALFGEVPFSPQTHYGIRDDGIVVFPGEPYEFFVLSSEGSRVCGYRASYAVRPVTESDRRRHLHHWVREYGGEDVWRIREEMFASVDYPDRMPAYRSAYVDTEGTAWIEPYAEWDGMRRTFVGYDESGAVAGSVVLPWSAEPLDFGTGWVVTLEKEASGAEVVRLRGQSP